MRAAAAPHALFAIVASTVGTGEAFAGVALEVGEGYVVIASSVLDGVRQAVISYSPPFTPAGASEVLRGNAIQSNCWSLATVLVRDPVPLIALT